MIKNIFKIAVPIVLLCGCYKDNLDINPSDQYSVETFWKTEEQASAGLSGCYKVLQLVYSGGWIFETDMISPNGWRYNAEGGVSPVSLGVHTPNTPVVSDRWNVAYQGIGRTNTFLGKIGGITMADALKSRMTGEAKFLRALYYFNLVDLFGGVPLILDMPNPATQSDLPRDTKEKVVDQILKDLDDAASVLPTNFTGKDIGRATKGAALALKARMLLYTEKWAEAAKTAKDIMDLKVYTLFPNYRDLFLLQNEHNNEVIFDVEFLSPQFNNNFDQPIYVLNNPAPLKDLVDSYLMADGKTTANSPLYNPSKPYENRDPRLHQTIAVIGYKFNGKITQLSNVVNTGFGLKKYTSYTDEVNVPTVAPSTELNPILSRYAEVLLTYAEAQNEFSGPNESVYAALDEVRNRTSVNMPKVERGLTKAQLREVIRNERRIELAFEGLYYSDIRRWKTIETVNNGPIFNYQGKAITIRAFNKQRDYLWPVPFVEIQKNRNLTQNPNWN